MSAYDSIPPNYAVSQVIGFIKGKSAIHLARVYGETAEFCRAKLLGARVLRSTVGGDEEVITELHSRTRSKRISDWSR